MSAVVEATTFLSTAVGMHALWQPEIFQYDSGGRQRPEPDEHELLRHISQGTLVPINLGLNGGWQFVVRCSTGDLPARLTERERAYLYLRSEPYRIICRSHLLLTGLEQVIPQATRETPPDPAVALRLDLPPGEYSVTVHVIDVAADPAAVDANGEVTADAPPDFVILVSRPALLHSGGIPASADHRLLYRQQLQTFEPAEPG
jgi:hypothetical protein